MKKVLLLDFDGVIFKHKNAINIVSNKAARYVKKITNVNNKDSHIINKYLYKSFGHSVTGLIKMGYDVSMTDYNNFVYDNLDFKKLFKNIDKKDVDNINNIIIYCKKYKIHSCIFTNSPPIWYNNILDYINVDKNQFDYIDNYDMLKPNKDIYDLIEDKYKNHDKIYFVDDSFVNFTHTLSNPKWINIMLDNKTIKINHNNIKIIKDLEDIINILNE